MKFFLDSAKIDEIKQALDLWEIDGVTTNPRHVLASGRSFLSVIREIGALFEGTERTLSVEVNPHFDRPEQMIQQAEELAAMSSSFVIKLPATPAGFQALRVLSEKGIRVNLTLVFSAVQALQAMRDGAFYVSPFIGWRDEIGEESRQRIRDIVAIRDNYLFDTEVLVAAVRNGRQIVDAAVDGADIVTAGFDLYRRALEHDMTGYGLDKFREAWDQTRYE